MTSIVGFQIGTVILPILGIKLSLNLLNIKSTQIPYSAWSYYVFRGHMLDEKVFD